MRQQRHSLLSSLLFFLKVQKKLLVFKKENTHIQKKNKNIVLLKMIHLSILLRNSISSAASCSSQILKYPYQVIDTEETLVQAASTLQKSERFSVDIEAFCSPQASDKKELGKISLIQMCGNNFPGVYLVDVVTLGIPVVLQHIEPLMTCTHIQKLMYDCRRDVEAMSSQMKMKVQGVLDLQLFFTALQWKAKSVNRRSAMSYVIKSVCGVTRQDGDSAVQAAMTFGNRAVWDVRPLPVHFLEYAADDVKHILMLAESLVAQHPALVDPVQRLTANYVDHYAIERPVEVEADEKAHEVSVDWLQLFAGPGGRCQFCSSKGHTEAECFKKQSNVMKCTHCSEIGHIAKNCYRKYPELNKCSFCGQLGHTEARCFKKKKCVHCGSEHASDMCLKKKAQS